MRHGTDDNEQPAFNDIRIDLRNGGGGGGLSNNPTYYGNRYPPDNDQRSQGSVPSRVSRYSEYPQVRPTNPLYSSQSTIRTQGSQPHAGGASSSKSSATLVNRVRNLIHKHHAVRPIGDGSQYYVSFCFFH
ncbi:hypothetical protein I4U23_019100 [Adineta vaga]|nr:hypothetical protein I4U23_019100 [Adineta vaga]